MKNSFLWFLALVGCCALLNGCGRFEEKFGRLNSGQSKVTFLFPGSSGMEIATQLNGGLLIYALSNNNGLRQTFFFSSEAIANATTTSISLPNDSYKFAAIGFLNAGMGGGAKCALASPEDYVLQGANSTVSFNLTTAQCGNAIFSTGSNTFDSTYGYKPMQFVSCMASTSLASLTGTGSSCSSSNMGDLNHVRSAKVNLLGYLAPNGPLSFNQTAPALSSSCIRGGGIAGGNPLFSSSSTAAESIFALTDSELFFGFGSGTLGLMRTLDGGTTVTTVIPSVNTFGVVGDATKLFAATQSGLYTSTDNGTTWTFVSAGDFRSVAKLGNTVLATPTGGVNNAMVSLDGGVTFSTYTIASPNAVTAIWTTLIDSSGTLYVGGQDGSNNAKLYSSSDNGVTWTQLLSIASGTNIESFRIYNNTMYAASAAQGLYVKPVTGGSWTVYCSSPCAHPGTLPSNVVSDVLVKNGVLYVGTSLGLGVSPDLGTTWENYTTGSYAGLVRRLSMPAETLFYSFSGGTNGMRRSDNRGSGAAFPTGPITGWPIVPVGGGTAAVRPFATSISVYSDPACTSLKRTYFFPEGFGYGGNTPSALSKFIFDGGSASRVFLLDY